MLGFHPVSMLSRWALRFREARSLTQGNTASWGWRELGEDSNPGLSDSTACSPTRLPQGNEDDAGRAVRQAWEPPAGAPGPSCDRFRTGSEGSRASVLSQLCHRVAAWPGVSDFTSLCPGFPTGKPGGKCQPLRAAGEGWISTHNVLLLVPREVPAPPPPPTWAQLSRSCSSPGYVSDQPPPPRGPMTSHSKACPSHY